MKPPRCVIPAGRTGGLGIQTMVFKQVVALFGTEQMNLRLREGVGGGVNLRASRVISGCFSKLRKEPASFIQRGIVRDIGKCARDSFERPLRPLRSRLSTSLRGQLIVVMSRHEKSPLRHKAQRGLQILLKVTTPDQGTGRARPPEISSSLAPSAAMRPAPSLPLAHGRGWVRACERFR